MTADMRARLVADSQAILARYPQSRSALLPMLHLVQSEQGYVSPEGIELCAEILGLTTAEVSAVATFYTMYKRRPVGDYSVGVCTNTLCAIMGGDEIFATLKSHLGIGHDETTEDGLITLEHLECNAACDYAPVVMVNWEFYDNQTPQSAVALVEGIRAGAPPAPTRGPRLCTFRQVSRVLAGFSDGLADEGPSGGPATLAGVHLADELARRGEATGDRTGAPGPRAPGRVEGYGIAGGPSANDEPVGTSASDPANTTPPQDPGTSDERGTR
ncbi:MAG: NADH-quinone oxidoreductase subunit NuoE [Actinomycetota bacterium]|nr:NADH-quinone oxidoreductase subunit NuoE [Actinomycetota bacterium]